MVVIGRNGSGGNMEVTSVGTKYATGWTGNYSSAYRMGDLVICNIYVYGAMGANKYIFTDLPAGSATFIIPSSLGNSEAVIRNGSMYISSAGTTQTGYFGGCVAYKATS